MTNKQSNYQLVCGMEVHAELKTNSKMFCGCKNDPFHAKEPNNHTCPVCLGMPGGIPVPNQKAIEWTIKLGLALNCDINLFSKFDRKHYFYPDLPKGYQISQYDIPFCYDGYIETSEGKVRINRIHLEEDTGKLQHKKVDGKKVSLIDFNRSGVPLIEIVTEADITSPQQAKEYGKKLRQILRYLEIADCDMDQGGMRLEANISLQSIKAAEGELPNYKVEVKNINSFRFLEQAISYEMERQEVVLNKGEKPAQETRGWDTTKNQTFVQRSKEDAEDYRYFPDSDIPPIRFTQKWLDDTRKALPQLPEVVVTNWQKKYQVEPRFAEQLITSVQDVETLEMAFSQLHKTKIEPNTLASDLVNKKVTLKISDASPEQLIEAVTKLHETAELDTDQLNTIIEQVMQQNPDEVTRFQAGETKLTNFFIGQIMRELKQKVDVNQVREALNEAMLR